MGRLRSEKAVPGALRDLRLEAVDDLPLVLEKSTESAAIGVVKVGIETEMDVLGADEP